MVSTPGVAFIKYFYFAAEIVIIKKNHTKQNNKKTPNQNKNINVTARCETGPRNFVTHQFCILELCFHVGPLISGLHDSQHAKDQE